MFVWGSRLKWDKYTHAYWCTLAHMHTIMHMHMHMHKQTHTPGEVTWGDRVRGIRDILLTSKIVQIFILPIAITCAYEVCYHKWKHTRHKNIYMNHAYYWKYEHAALMQTCSTYRITVLSQSRVWLKSSYTDYTNVWSHYIGHMTNYQNHALWHCLLIFWTCGQMLSHLRL